MRSHNFCYDYGYDLCGVAHFGVHLFATNGVILYTLVAVAWLVNDPMLMADSVRWCAKLWANGANLNSPTLSPIFADLTRLPPIHIYQGENDILCPDAKKFAQKASGQKADCTLHLYENAFQAFMVLPDVLPEARAVLDDMVKVMKG